MEGEDKIFFNKGDRLLPSDRYCALFPIFSESNIALPVPPSPGTHNNESFALTPKGFPWKFTKSLVEVYNNREREESESRPCEWYHANLRHASFTPLGVIFFSFFLHVLRTAVWSAETRWEKKN